MYTRGLLIFLLMGLCSLRASNSPLTFNTEFSSGKPFDLLFIENKGQLKAIDGKPGMEVLYTLKYSGVRVYIHRKGLYYQFSSHTDSSRLTTEPEKITEVPAGHDTRKAEKKNQHNGLYGLNMQLLGANNPSKVVAEQPAAYYENYYNGSDPTGGISKARSFRKVIIKDIYPKIDWVLYVYGGKLKHDFIVNPGGKVSDIKMRYFGAEDILKNRDGGITIKTPVGQVQEGRPYTYQPGKTAATKVASSYSILSENTIGFDAADYQTNKPLVIDPSISWATYYGGSGFDSGTSTTIDSNGDFYLAGWTESTNGISSTGFQNTSGGSSDAFLVKFDANGNRLWATYYGGQKNEKAHKIRLDNNGHIYMTGETESDLSIASGGMQNSYGGSSDAFLVKFNGEGERLWATYFGGSGFESGHSIGIDSKNNVYLTGITESTSGIASGGSQNTFGGAYDTFLAKFNASGERIWSTYYGGSGEENTMDGHKSTLAIDGNDNVYISGWTSSADVIGVGGFKNSISGNGDAYLAKFSPQGNPLWSTYYGGENFDSGRGVTIDEQNNVYMTGTTKSTQGIASGGFQETAGGHYDAFLVKFSKEGQRMWGTYYGGGGQDEAKEGSLAIDNNGYIYMGGFTNSSDGIASCGFQNSPGGSFDAFVVKFDAAGNRQWGSYFGGSGFEISFDFRTDNGGYLYMVGWSSSSSGISSGGYQNTYRGGGDAYLLKIDPAKETIEKPEITSDGQLPLCSGESITLSVPLLEDITYEWRLGQQLLNESGNSITVTKAGKYTATLFNACDTTTSDTVEVKVLAMETAPAITASGPVRFCGEEGVTLSLPAEDGYTYQWQKDGLPIEGNSFELTVRESGLYRCLLTNQCGSLSTEAIAVEAGVAPDPPIPEPQETMQCGPAALSLRVTGGTNSEYRWYRNQTDSSPIAGETSNVFVTPPLDSSATYYASIIQGQCESSRIGVPAVIHTPPDAYAGEDVKIQAGEQVQLQASGGAFYSWSPAFGLSNPTIPNPIAMPNATITYLLTVTDTAGCSATDKLTIEVSEGAFIPNAFSPNNDGRNDFWEIFNLEAYPNCRIVVVNRWGNPVFESRGYKEPWDGTYRGERVPAGTYAYFIYLEHTSEPLKGSVLVID